MTEETVAQFAKRMGMGLTAVSRKLHAPDCPVRSFTAITGESGRIVTLFASPELEAYIRKNKCAK